MFCSECGTKVNDGAKFCFQCGAKLTGGEQEIGKEEISEKKVSEEFVAYAEGKVIEAYLTSDRLPVENLYKKSKFYEVEEIEVDKIVESCRSKITKLEQFMDSIYEECSLFLLDENEEEEIINFGNSLGFADDDIEDLLDKYDEDHLTEEKQEFYTECIMKYIDNGKIQMPQNSVDREYQIEVFELFKKNILKFEEILREQYKKTKDYDLTKAQVEFVYAEGEKIFPEESIVGIIYSYDKKNGIIAKREEQEKKKAFERMTKFHLYGELIAFTEEECVGIQTGKSYRKTYGIVRDDFLKFYNSADCTKDGYWDELNKKVLTLINAIYEGMVKTLEKRGVSSEDISKIEYAEIYKYWIPVFEDIDYQYNVICIGTEGAEYYRKLRKENRGRLIGGGFGLAGAAKGIATAGAINLATGAVHSAFNFVGNIKSEWKKLQAIKDLFGYSLKNKVLKVLQNTIQLMYVTELAVMDAYNVPNRSFQLFFDEEVERKKVFEVQELKKCPFDRRLYNEAIAKKLNDDVNMKKFAEFTGIDIGEFIAIRNKKELEARTEDGITFPTISDKERYCKDKEVYTVLFDEIKGINVWIEKDKFIQKYEELKKKEEPYSSQWKNKKKNFIKWCSDILKETDTPNSVYLAEVLKVATSESWQETVVRQGHNNYNSLLGYFKGKINFDADEKIALFIVSYKEKPNQALLFGNKHNYYVKGDELIKFDFVQLYDIRYEIEKGFILNDKITRFEVVLLDGTIINMTSLFSSRGSSNYAISSTFMLAMKTCLKMAQKSYDKASVDAATTLSKQMLQKKYEKAVNYEEGNGVEKNTELAIKLYKELADAGFSDAQCRLAGFYYYGNGVAENTEKAMKLLELASNQGNLEAMYLLAWMYSSIFNHHKKIDPKTFDDKKAVKLLLEAAKANNTKAQDALATHYYEGVGVEQNFEKAVYWARKAAEKGDDVAQYHLGCCYEYGAGIAESKEMATYWYNEAAKKGHKMAEKKLKALRKQGYKIENIQSYNSNEDNTEKRVNGGSNDVQEDAKMFCPYCGEKILRTVKYCNFCGNEIIYKRKS